jgi:hypothetical protein
MPRYQFIVKETPHGKAHHSDPAPHRHVDRRELLAQKGNVIDVERAKAVEEAYVGGFGYYTWTVDAPSITAVIAVMQECERHGFVEIYSGLTLVPTDKDKSDIDGFLAEMRRRFPDQ